MSSGITLKKKWHRIYYQSKSLENSGILLKGTICGLFMQVGLLLLKNVFTLLAKSVLVPLASMAALLATDVAT